MCFSGLMGGCTVSPLFQEEYVQGCNLLRLFLCFILTSKGRVTEGGQEILIPKRGPLNLNHLVLQPHKIGNPRILFSLTQKD